MVIQNAFFRVARACVGAAIVVCVAAPGSVDAAARSKSDSRKITESVQACALLDDPKAVQLMDGLLFYLAKACGREEDFVGQVDPDFLGGEGVEGDPDLDLAVSNPTGDTGSTRTQSESSIERNPVTGTLCAAYNDSFHGVTQGTGFSGFSRSVDGGSVWVDRGAVSNDDSGDPSLVWRRLDGKFYYAALRSGGLALYRSDDDCLTFTFVSQIATGNDDKEIMAIDNEPTSPFYGRIYIVWTDFGLNAQIYSIHSANAGTTWSTQLALSVNGDDTQGAWPTIAPNGDVYVAWLKWLAPGFPTGDVEVPVFRSTNGGTSYAALVPPVTGQDNPRDSAATTSCGRPALGGNIRNLPSPQIVFRNGFLHAVYSYDANGFGVGDASDIFYRRYNATTSTWLPEVKINDDATTTDQWQPTIAVGAQNQVTIGYYSKQNDTANNRAFDYYSRTSYDGGATWEPSVRLSDASSAIVLDSQLATCYHGDYDQQLQDGLGKAVYLWSDDRGAAPPAGSGPDIKSDRTLVGVDFLVSATEASASVCAPTSAVYPLSVLQFQGFTQPVTLTATGAPAPSVVVFGTNPVTPPGTSSATVPTAGVAPGSSTITITGTSAPGGIVHTTNLGLTVFTLIPAAPALVAPADNATNVALRPTFSWTALAQASDYVLEVSANATFTGPLLYTATVTGTSHVPTVDLPSNSRVYWRLRSRNVCGIGPDSPTFSFVLVPLPGDCPVSTTATTGFTDDMETSDGAWAHTGTGDTWVRSNLRAHTGALAWRAADPTTQSDQRLVSPPMAVPAGALPASLIYWSYQLMEDRGGGCYDGGILEVSNDNGVTWTQMLNPVLLTDPYDGPLGGSNPAVPAPAWCGDPQDWTRTVVSLDAFAGQTVKFRFRMTSDTSVGRTDGGWFIDDLKIQSCSGTPPDDLFKNGFE